jgi:hypothetical protein
MSFKKAAEVEACDDGSAHRKLGNKAFASKEFSFWMSSRSMQ